jgi:hypothetical protein
MHFNVASTSIISLNFHESITVSVNMDIQLHLEMAKPLQAHLQSVVVSLVDIYFAILVSLKKCRFCSGSTLLN